MSETTVRTGLAVVLGNWLTEQADDIGSTYGIYQDDSSEDKNVELCADAVMLVLRAMRLQEQLHNYYEAD